MSCKPQHDGCESHSAISELASSCSGDKAEDFADKTKSKGKEAANKVDDAANDVKGQAKKAAN